MVKMRINEQNPVTLIIDVNRLNPLNKILNKQLSKTYDWFKEIRIKTVIINELASSMRVEGEISIDSSWGFRKFIEGNNVQSMPPVLMLGDIFFSDDKIYLELQNTIGNYFSSIYGFLKPDRVGIGGV